MNKKITIGIPVFLLLNVAAWLTGRHSGARDDTGESLSSSAGRLAAVTSPSPSEQADIPLLSIPAGVLVSAEAFEKWLTEVTRNSHAGPPLKELWLQDAAMRNLRVEEMLSRLEDESLKALGDFLLQPPVRAHFRDSQTFPHFLSRALAETGRRNKPALTAWIRKAAADGEDAAWFCYHAGCLPFTERLDLVRHLKTTGDSPPDPADTLRVALSTLQPHETGTAVRMAESLSPDRQTEAFGEIAGALAFGQGDGSREWPPETIPVFARAFPGEKAAGLTAAQTFNALFRNRLAGGNATPQECAEWLGAQTMPALLRTTAVNELLSVWSVLDAPAAAAWHLQTGSHESKPKTLETILAKWTAQSPYYRAPMESRVADAAEWLNKTETGPAADPARAALAKAWLAIGEPATAEVWSSAITDPVLREHTMRAFTVPGGSASPSWQSMIAAMIEGQQE